MFHEDACNQPHYWSGVAASFARSTPYYYLQLIVRIDVKTIDIDSLIILRKEEIRKMKVCSVNS